MTVTLPAPLGTDQFLELFDEFKCVPKPKVDAYIKIALQRVSIPVWGVSATYATALLTAHMLASTGGVGGSGGAAGGAVTSEAVGEVSISYAAPAIEPGSSDAYYATTRYGQEYVTLRNQNIVPGFATGYAYGGPCG